MTTQNYTDYIKNLYYTIRYRLFKKFLTPIIWETPDWEENWNNPKYQIISDYMYNKNSYTSKDCVEILSDGLHLKVENLNSPEYRSHWSGEFMCYYKIGWVEYHNIFGESPYGTWVFNFKNPIKPAFPAIWFLREPYSPEELRFKCGVSKIENNTVKLSETPEINPGVNWWLLDIDNNVLGRIQSYDETNKIITIDKNIENVDQTEILISGDCITPEIDLMEIWGRNRTYFGYAVHYGPSYDTYAPYVAGNNVCKADEIDYEFAIKFSPEKYEFFLDGIKTAEYTVGLSDKKLYLLINTAVLEGVTENVNIPDFIIKRIRYYQYDKNLVGKIDCNI